MNENRVYLYAFLSRMFADILDEKAIEELKNNDTLLELLGRDTKNYFLTHDLKTIKEECNIDYTSLFIMHNHPVESATFDNSKDIVTGMENPVMQFYMDYGYEVNMNATHIMAPDHMAIEIGFMQSLIYRKEALEVQAKFLEEHIMNWMPPFLLACTDMAETPFYKDLCSFASEFFISDYHELKCEIA